MFMTKTFKELLEANTVVSTLFAKNPDLKETKFGYAWKKFYALNIEKVVKEMQAAYADAQIEHALEDKTTGKIMTEPGSPRGYAYSKQGLRDLIKAEDNIEKDYYAKEIEIEPYISTYIPENITEIQLEALKGLVLPE